MAFRGSAAIAAGLVTAKVLRGPRYLRLFPDTYVRCTAEPPDLRLRSLAAYRYVEGRGVLSGHSAAVLLGADCAAPDAPAEVTVRAGGQRAHDGLVVHHDALLEGEVRACREALVTSPLRTAYDLGRGCTASPRTRCTSSPTRSRRRSSAPSRRAEREGPRRARKGR